MWKKLDDFKITLTVVKSVFHVISLSFFFTTHALNETYFSKDDALFQLQVSGEAGVLHLGLQFQLFNNLLEYTCPLRVAILNCLL